MYATDDDVKDYLGISGSGDDTLINGLIRAAQAAIETHTNRVFEVTSNSTRYYDAIGEHIKDGVLYLDDDLCEVNSVTNGDGNAIASSKYTTLPRNDTPYYAIRLLSDSDTLWEYGDEWMDAIEISGKWGYSTQAPNDVRQACIRLAAFYYRQKDSQLADVTAIEAGTVIRTPAMPADVKSILGPYRRL